MWEMHLDTEPTSGRLHCDNPKPSPVQFGIAVRVRKCLRILQPLREIPILAGITRHVANVRGLMIVRVNGVADLWIATGRCMRCCFVKETRHGREYCRRLASTDHGKACRRAWFVQT